MVRSDQFKIGIVGPCGAGKSTLVNGLRNDGFVAKQIAQEHSYVPTMWRRLVNPHVLIYLDASFMVCTERRKLDWTLDEFNQQLKRLDHARVHADLLVQTDLLTPQQILKLVLDYLRTASELDIGQADNSLV